MGAYAGVLMVYLIFNEPLESYFLWPNTDIPGGIGATWYISEWGNIYYLKIIWLEFWNTFIFAFAYLLIIYKPSIRTVDEIIKGIAISLILYSCFYMTAESGGSLNPAFAIAQNSYETGWLNAY